MAPIQQAAAAAEEEEPGLMADASVDALEVEVADGPEGNWEVAYVYAFLEKFTELRDVSYHSNFKNVFDLEQALLDSSPPVKLQRKAAIAAKSNGNGKRASSPTSSLSSLTDDEDESASSLPSNPPIPAVPPPLPADTPTPPASELLVTIIEEFKSNLSTVPDLNDYHGKKSWLTWLINFVGKRFTADQFRGGFRWETNLLRTRGLKPGQEDEKMFWLLRWEDKIHLLRQLVDFQLTSSAKIRDVIKTEYDLGQQRNAQRTSATNSLVLEPLGRLSSSFGKRMLYHLDETPRLYASGNLHKTSSPWTCVASTTEGYKAYTLQLAEPVQKGKKGGKGPFEMAKGKAKAGSKDDPKREERLVRARLEKELEAVVEYDEAMAKINTQRLRVTERLANRDARVARTLSRLGGGTTTRSTRLRNRVNYANDGVGDEDDDDDDDAGEEGSEPAETAGRKRRRADHAYDDEGAEDDDGASVASSSKRRSTRNLAAAFVVPPERASARLRMQQAQEDDEEGEAKHAIEDGVAAELGVKTETDIATQAEPDSSTSNGGEHSTGPSPQPESVSSVSASGAAEEEEEKKKPVGEANGEAKMEVDAEA
ncbi:hypothetical protein JCM1841_004128 [Sporobolomyces salmonicolor]